MHSKSVDSLSLTRAGFIEYFLVATKLVHALTAIAPALFLLYYPGLVPVELRSNMLGLLLFFGALTVIMFQALDVYSDDIFSNRLRFRIMFFAWASAFCLLLFMYQGLGLFPYLSSKLVIFWFTGSLLLFGVLAGSMSMVGPRPHATATKAAGIPFEEAVSEYSSRHRVKPGITGWAQINGYRGETDTLHKIKKRVEYDLEYIAKWSVWFDLYILFRTVPAVLLTKEVY